MKIKLLLSIFTLSLFCSCTSLRVTTDILKSYPPLGETDSVVVYHQGETPPEEAIPLGRISLIDAGASKRYKYDEVVTIAKSETRKYGGNIFYVTDVVKPSVWGSNSYQMSGMALREGILDSDEVSLTSSKGEFRSLSRNFEPLRKLPSSFEVFANFGYGQMLATTEGVMFDLERFEKELNSGTVFDAGVSFYPNKWRNMGIGVLYSNFFSSSIYNKTKFNLSVQYIGASFLYKTYMSKSSERWLFDVEYGLGYLGYRIKQNDGLKSTSSTLGVNLGIGFEYALSKRLALQTDFRLISGSFRTINFNDGSPSVKLGRDERIGGDRLNFTFGIVYYLGK